MELRAAKSVFIDWQPGDFVDKAREFQQKARACCDTAAKAPVPDIRPAYENLARMWDRLAQERLTYFVQRPHVGAKETNHE